MPDTCTHNDLKLIGFFFIPITSRYMLKKYGDKAHKIVFYREMKRLKEGKKPAYKL